MSSSLYHPLLPLLLELSDLIRTRVLAILGEVPVHERSRSTGHCGADVIYWIDREIESIICDVLQREASNLGGVVLIAEGIGENGLSIFTESGRDADCAWRLIMDPIDGTRPIMMDKRSAWFLAGVAPNRGQETRLREIECAVQAELPTSRAGCADDFVAVRAKGVQALRHEIAGGAMVDSAPTPWSPQPWQGPELRGGFAQLMRFCSPGREHLAAIEEKMLASLYPDAEEGEILSFEDQYAATGGQLIELLCGRDRFTADVRAALFASRHFRGKRTGHVCHPYDLAGFLVAEEAGVEITDLSGNPLDGPLDTLTGMNWAGYANPRIRSEVEPVFLRELERCLVG